MPYELSIRKIQLIQNINQNQLTWKKIKFQNTSQHISEVYHRKYSNQKDAHNLLRTVINVYT